MIFLLPSIDDVARLQSPLESFSSASFLWKKKTTASNYEKKRRRKRGEEELFDDSWRAHYPSRRYRVGEIHQIGRVRADERERNGWKQETEQNRNAQVRGAILRVRQGRNKGRNTHTHTHTQTDAQTNQQTHRDTDTGPVSIALVRHNGRPMVVARKENRNEWNRRRNRSTVAQTPTKQNAVLVGSFFFSIFKFSSIETHQSDCQCFFLIFFWNFHFGFHLNKKQIRTTANSCSNTHKTKWSSCRVI